MSVKKELKQAQKDIKSLQAAVVVIEEQLAGLKPDSKVDKKIAKIKQKGKDKKTDKTEKTDKSADVNIDALRSKLGELQNELGKEKVKKVLSAFDVKNISKLPEAQYEEVYDACNELLENAL